MTEEMNRMRKGFVPVAERERGDGRPSGPVRERLARFPVQDGM
ncbi:hypothetical protein [Streptomyces sp. NPDC049916]